eukprot:TRINITY_DN8707_c0_g2_i1.p1 TRINITY_DN8707_c0_g2~~TRINITY_DN8707_c0_g2_i1.p1  ORF type:complete len:379 (-),score=81.51 TRINITY_DN8707_c0_g2_i1:902-1927(-)
MGRGRGRGQQQPQSGQKFQGPYGGWWGTQRGGWNDQRPQDPFASVTQAFDTALNSCQSLARLSQLGQALSSLDSGKGLSTGAGIAQVQGGQVVQNGPPTTSSMSTALLNAINAQGTQQQHMVVQQQAAPQAGGVAPPQLQAGGNGQAPGGGAGAGAISAEFFETMIANSKAFASLGNRVSGMEEQMTAQSKDMNDMKKSMDSHEMLLKNILDAVKPGGNKAAVPPPVEPPGVHGQAPAAENAAPSAMTFLTGSEPEVDGPRNEWFCSKFGVSITRMDTFVQVPEGQSISVRSYLQGAKGTKDLKQWICKLKALGVGQSDLDELESKESVMKFIYTHMWDEL